MSAAGIASRPLGLFDQEIRQRKLQALGGPLVDLGRIVPRAISVRRWRRRMRLATGRDTRKGGSPSHKNHINTDVRHGIIRDYAVTPAAVHDSQALPELLDITQRGQPLYADSAYRSAVTARHCKGHGLIHRVLHKAQRNRTLTGAKKRTNYRWADAHAPWICSAVASCRAARTWRTRRGEAR